MKVQEGINQINKLLEALEGTDINEALYKHGSITVGFKRHMTEEPEKEPEAAPVGVSAKDSSKEIIEVVSHSVGIFRDYSAPSRKSLAKIGQNVNKGEKLGFIESMKIFKELISPVKGVIVNKFVKNGDPIEYGKKLFEIEIV